jgi:hypothetical protein
MLSESFEGIYRRYGYTVLLIQTKKWYKLGDSGLMYPEDDDSFYDHPSKHGWALVAPKEFVEWGR